MIVVPLSVEERRAVLGLLEEFEEIETRLELSRRSLLDDLVALERETEDSSQRRKRQERKNERLAIEAARELEAARQRRDTHGNRTMYNRGCRCDLCRAANTAWSRYYNAERAKTRRLRAA